MRTHISKTVSSYFAVLRQIRSIRRPVTRPVLHSLVASLVLTRLDYGCSTLAGLPVWQLNRLLSVMKSAAWLVYSASRSEHLVFFNSSIDTSLIRDIYCGPKVLFKTCVAIKFVDDDDDDDIIYLQDIDGQVFQSYSTSQVAETNFGHLQRNADQGLSVKVRPRFS